MSVPLPLPHEYNNIVFAQYLEENHRNLWSTWSTVNKHTNFCREADCSAVAYASLGYRCEGCYHAYIVQGRVAQLPRFAKEAAIERIERHHAFNTPHRCCGFRYDYNLGGIICDFADEPDCPQYKPPTKPCADCGSAKEDAKQAPTGDWLCSLCWQTRVEAEAEAEDNVLNNAVDGATVVNRWLTHVAALSQCDDCHTRDGTLLRHDAVGNVYFLDCVACGGCRRVDKELLEAL
jgi:hypothetical protein